MAHQAIFMVCHVHLSQAHGNRPCPSRSAAAENCPSGWPRTGPGNPRRCHRHAACSSTALILSLGMKEIYLRLLVCAQGDHVQRLGLGNLFNAAHCGFHAGESEMMPQDGIGRLSADAFPPSTGDNPLRSPPGWFALSGTPALLRAFRSRRDPLEESEPAGSFRHRRRAPEREAHALHVQGRALRRTVPTGVRPFRASNDKTRPPGRPFLSWPPPAHLGWLLPGREKPSASPPPLPGAESWKHLLRGRIPQRSRYDHFSVHISTSAPSLMPNSRSLPGDARRWIEIRPLPCLYNTKREKGLSRVCWKSRVKINCHAVDKVLNLYQPYWLLHVYFINGYGGRNEIHNLVVYRSGNSFFSWQQPASVWEVLFYWARLGGAQGVTGIGSAGVLLGVIALVAGIVMIVFAARKTKTDTAQKCHPQGGPAR